MIKLIIWVLLIYLVYSVMSNVMKIVRGYNAKTESKIKPSKTTKYNINKDDVIEAQFEEINPAASSKSKEKI
jgi:hypothetical protein